MPQPKIVAIGIGSFSFGVELLRDVFQTEALRGCRLDLVDLDDVALRRMAGLAQKLNEASGWQVDIRPTTNREDALPGADFVVTSIEINRDALWKLDHEICMRHGLGSVLSENGGPGGLSHALRTVPLMIAVARDIERFCPNALLLNYTNPEGRICLAIRRHTSVRAVGLCHGVAGAVFWVASVLGREPSTIDLRAAGTNHFTWMTTLTDAATGEDLYPEFRARLTERPDDRPLARMLCQRFGLCPTSSGDSHVGEFIGYAAEIVGTKGYDFAEVAQTRKHAIANIDGWASGEKSVASLLAAPSREERVHMGVTHIMADALTGGSGRRPSFNLPNDGYIENISRDAIVEVPGIVDKGRVCGVPVGPLPGPIASLVQNEVEIQKLVVDAAVTGDRNLALAALTLDPVVNSARKAEALLDDILASHAAYLPQFA